MPQNSCSVELCLSYPTQIHEKPVITDRWFFIIMWNLRPRDLQKRARKPYPRRSDLTDRVGDRF